jgi:hypothetical protein
MPSIAAFYLCSEGVWVCLVRSLSHGWSSLCVCAVRVAGEGPDPPVQGTPGKRRVVKNLKDSGSKMSWSRTPSSSASRTPLSSVTNRVSPYHWSRALVGAFVMSVVRVLVVFLSK